jgi:hypothetical protein
MQSPIFNPVEDDNHLAPRQRPGQSTMSAPHSPVRLMGSPLSIPSLSPNQHLFEGNAPFHSSLSSPCYTKAIKTAVDIAISNEKDRIRTLEETEIDLGADELRQILKKERQRTCKLVGELASMKSTAVASQAEAEVFEEGRINCLMRRLDSLQKEKGRIIVELEREEEMLTNTLQKKLNQVRREKAELEQQIEREHAANEKAKKMLL